jgi:glycosyltransferase involved in cell wall biosynthesis
MADLKILYITSDASVGEEGSAESERLKSYGKVLEEIHVVVICPAELGLKEKQLDKNVWLYPADYSFGYLASGKAASIGKKIVFDRKFTRGQSVIVASDPYDAGKAGVAIRKRWKLPLEVEMRTDTNTLGFFEAFSVTRVLKQASVASVETQAGAELLSKNLGLGMNAIVIDPPHIDTRIIDEGRLLFDPRARYGWRFTLLTANDLTEKNNTKTLLEALSKLRAYIPDVGLVIAGSGPMKQKLMNLARDLDLKLSAIFIDGDSEELPTYYKTASAYIETAGFKSYGQEIVLAGRAGLPVVTTPTGLALDLVNGKEALFYPTGDSEYLFKTIYDLLQNNDLRENLKRNLRAALEEKAMSEENSLAARKSNWDRIAGMIQAS